MGERVREPANRRYRNAMTSKAPPLLGTARDWAVDLAVAVAAGLFFGLVGPYGSYFNGPSGPRVFHFVVTFVVGAVLFGVLIRLAVATNRRFATPLWPILAAAALASNALLSVFVRWLATTLWPGVAYIKPLEWFIQCVVLSAPVVAYMIFRRALWVRPTSRIAALEPGATPSVEPAPGDVLCLRMEDHYVRVHTQAGSRLVAGPFERVIAGLGVVEGMRVHRSWWVARAAVTGVVADGRNLRLTLRGDLSAPVSRASVARLRAAGWLAPEAAGEG
jgi:hypothetical protein